MADDGTLPTKEEIAQLPRWARVAFAARCARRVLPLFQKHWPEAPVGLESAVSRAVESTERAAGSPTPSTYKQASRDASNAKGALETAPSAARDVASIVIDAAEAAYSTGANFISRALDEIARVIQAEAIRSARRW